MAINVRANGYDRVDLPVQLSGDFGKPLRVVEVDQRASAIDMDVPFQVEEGNRLTILMRGETPADGFRFYQIYFGDGDAKPGEPLVRAEAGVMYQGQESIKVTTPAGEYYYHERGAGFASLIDRDENDWISYRPGDGPAGEFQGIPNMIHPEAGFHPGADVCSSELVASGPLVATIKSQCHDGAWKCTWDVFPNFARMTVEDVGHEYWFLYEGTPGGKLDSESDYWMRSDGVQASAAVQWDGRLEPPRWVYFGDAALERVLFLAQHNNDGTFDQYWPMDGLMTVFGFGRKLTCCEKSLVQTPATFSIGLIETKDFAEAELRINSAYRDVIISKGEVEQRGED